MAVRSMAWNAFCDRAADLLREFENGRVSFEEIVAFFETNPQLPAEERDAVVNLICEIGGSPGYYRQLKESFERRASLPELQAFLFNWT